jgi:hypothetical protein
MCEAFLASRRTTPSPPSHALTAFPSTREALRSAGKARCASNCRARFGEGLTALVRQRVGEERIVAFRFTRPTKRHFTQQWLAMSNSGRLRMDQADEAPAMIYARSHGKALHVFLDPPVLSSPFR